MKDVTANSINIVLHLSKIVVAFKLGDVFRPGYLKLGPDVFYWVVGLLLAGRKTWSWFSSRKALVERA